MNQNDVSTRRQSELCGAVCGVIGGAVGSSFGAEVWWIIGSSVLAGAAGNLFAHTNVESGVRPRAGVRAGVVTAVVAGATAVVFFTSTLGNFASKKILPMLLAIPPGAFFGLLGSLIVSMIHNPQVSPLGQREPKPKSRPSALFVVILLLSTIGYASPFLASLIPPKKIPEPAVAAAIPTPVPTSIRVATAKTEIPPPPPPWRFSPAADFANARPGSLRVQREQSLGRFVHPLRFIISADKQQFAFVRSATEIVLLDLHEPETETVFRVPEMPERFAISPDRKRVFVVSERGEKFVVDANSAKQLPLPSQLPEGPFTWPDEKRIAFGLVALDLDTLQLIPFSGEAQQPIARHPNIALRQTGRIMSVEGENIRGHRLYFLRDEKRDYAMLAPFSGENPILTPDATKLIFTNGDRLFVQYFEPSDSRETKLTATLPAAPPVELSEALASRSMVAMLCPAIINPLNNKPVAADLSRVKALLGIERWTDTTAEFWVKEDYGIAPSEGDVVAGFGRIENGRTLTLPTMATWWSLVRDIRKADAPDRIAPPTNLPPLPPPQAAPQFPMSPQLGNQLRAFLREHHAKSSRGDVDGLVANYAERVDHLTGSIVTRDRIREEEMRSRKPGSSLLETVRGEIGLVRISENEVWANYTMYFEQRMPSGNWATGFSELDLTLDISGLSPKITRQRARNFDVKKGP